jgi:phage portal protein BeeE
VPGALDRVNAAFAEVRSRPAAGETRGAIDQWLNEYLLPSGMVNQFAYGGQVYGFGGGLNLSYGQNKAREFSGDLPGHAAAVKACPPAFGAEMVRAMVLSQARFTFRNPRWMTAEYIAKRRSTPGRMFSTRDLAVLERPWPNGTTGDLIGRMEWHSGLAGNSFVTNWQQNSRLRVLRPDWTAVVSGSQSEPDDPVGALDAEVIGYAYQNGGFTPGNRNALITLPPSSVAHFAPLPDPLSPGMGMSWITPAVREIQGDMLAAQHKVTYFSNGATPNLVVKGIPAMSRDQFDDIVNMLEDRHTGTANAYRTLYLTAGADATVVGANLAEIDFRAVQAGGETRIGLLSRVPAPLLGIGEGLQGSSLNAGNFAASRRMFADSWIFPTLQNLASTLAPLVSVPVDAELWFDVADMPILREDAKDAADIGQVQAASITLLVRDGFTPESAVAAVTAQDMTLLVHSGMVSVQLWAPGVESPRVPLPGADSAGHPKGPTVPAKPPAAPAPAPPTAGSAGTGKGGPPSG